jgi:c-di-AMP phosphodiesterase-like protein
MAELSMSRSKCILLYQIIFWQIMGIGAHLAESERTVVITHTHADLDSVGSAVGLAATLDGTVDIATPSDVKAEAETLLENHVVVSEPELSVASIVNV